MILDLCGGGVTKAYVQQEINKAVFESGTCTPDSVQAQIDESISEIQKKHIVIHTRNLRRSDTLNDVLNAIQTIYVKNTTYPLDSMSGLFIDIVFEYRSTFKNYIFSHIPSDTYIKEDENGKKLIVRFEHREFRSVVIDGVEKWGQLYKTCAYSIKMDENDELTDNIVFIDQGYDDWFAEFIPISQ